MDITSKPSKAVLPAAHVNRKCALSPLYALTPPKLFLPEWLNSDTDDLTERLGETTHQDCNTSLLMLPSNLPRVSVFPKGRFQGSSCLSVKIIKNTKFICEVFSEKLGAIYYRRTKMKPAVGTLKTAVI